MISGYLTRRGGAVFTSQMWIIEKGDGLECEPKILAEPGDLVLLEDDLLTNLTRAAMGDPRIVYLVKHAEFVHGCAAS